MLRAFYLFTYSFPITAVVWLLCTATAMAGEPLPDKVLWAWQRPEDLSMIDPRQFAVAYLSAHVTIYGDLLHVHWRDQPLKVPPHTKLVAVVRIDVDRKYSDLSVDYPQRAKIVAVLVHAARRPGTSMLQIDFDALVSQRAFYKALLNDLRAALPAQTPISITALASWCLYDNWIKDLPVDETVPMMFSLGPEREKILLFFSSPGDFMVRSCCDSIGLSLEDRQVNELMIPLSKSRKMPFRYYIFTKTAWSREKLQSVISMLK